MALNLCGRYISNPEQAVGKYGYRSRQRGRGEKVAGCAEDFAEWFFKKFHLAPA
jgi:hypothetical protein